MFALDNVHWQVHKKVLQQSGAHLVSAVLAISHCLFDLFDIVEHFVARIFHATVAFFLQANLSDYPDMNKTPQQLIAMRGFQSETHLVESEGYLLQTIRIINPHETRSKLKPVLLHHGFLCCSTAWLVAGDGKLQSDGRYVEKGNGNVGNSLGFVLAARGYDVWLANARGSVYSRTHTTLSPESDQFWDFTMDDLAAKDLPALIEYIKTTTKRPSIGYIGHSQGSLLMFNLLSTQRHYSASIKPFIAISPIGFFTRTNLQLIMIYPFVKLLYYFRKKDFASHFYRKWGVAKLCTNGLMRYTFCYAVFNSINGCPWHSLNFDRLPVFMDQMAFGCSVKHLLHFFQHKIGFPVYFDHGSKLVNYAHYRQNYPPIYKYGNIASPHIALIYSQSDGYNHMADIQLLKNTLNVDPIVDYAVPDKSWNHICLLWGKEAGKYVNSKILDILLHY